MQSNRRQFLTSCASGAAMIMAAPLYRVAKADDGFIEITAGPTQRKLYPDDVEMSDLWLYNGSSPGPLIRARRGDRVKVRLINNLEEPTSIHWHGIRIDNKMDGVSGLTQAPVEAGGVFEYDFIVPDAGTYWYHAHHQSWKQVARGLYGPLIIDEDQRQFDDDHDITLVLDDWRLAQTGALDVESLGSLMEWSHGGRMGNWLTVNGQNDLQYSINAGEIYRLRVINASNARVLSLDPERFGGEIIAYDGQPVASEKIGGPAIIGPAQRIDFLLRPKAGQGFMLEETSSERAFPFASFKVAGQVDQAMGKLALASNDLPEPDLENAHDVRLHMTGGAMGNLEGISYKGKKLAGDDFRDTRQVWAFNSIANLPEKAFFTAKHGDTIILETYNDTAFSHAMHIHGHHFKIISLNGRSPAQSLWRDTFMINPTEKIKIAFVADNIGSWLLHCHMLEHAAAGMITWFSVEI